MSSPAKDTLSEYPEAHYPPPAERSAEMPMLWDEAHCRLIDSCVRSDSLYELLLQLPELANALEHNKTFKEMDFPVVETVQALRYGERAMCELLHSMPLKVVQSIVRNTVAYDDYKRQFPCFSMPNNKHERIPGVYVIGIRLEGTSGHFLNSGEMDFVIEDLKLYIEGYKACLKFKDIANSRGSAAAKKSLSSDEDKARRRAKNIDRHSGANDPDPTEVMFINSEKDLCMTQGLLRTFEGMRSGNLDPTGLIRSRQSPLYVGCSRNLRERVKAYTGSLRYINKPLALTLSILQKHACHPELVTRCVVRVWKDDQLDKAEQLVATLAGSLVYQHGFNATETGGTNSKNAMSEDALKVNTEYVISRCGTIIENVTNSILEVNIRNKFLQDLEKLQGQVAEISETLCECKEQLEGLPPGHQCSETLGAIHELISDLNKDLEDKEQALQFWRLMREIQEVIIKKTGQRISLKNSENARTEAL